jgi:hypothetical protein
MTYQDWRFLGCVVAALLCGCSSSLSWNECVLSTDCPDGYMCDDGRCVSHPVDADADTDSDVDVDADSDTDGDSDLDADIDDGPPGDAEADEEVFCEEVVSTVTETQEVFTVPPNVRYMHVKAWGAGGNGEGQCAFDDSGLGGFAEAVFEVDPGDPLVIIVGKRGRAGMSGEERVRFGFGDWGGGGLSGVFRGPDLITADDRDRALVIAGGGGSAGAPGCHPGGTGNHPSAGGMPSMQGGPGGDDINGGGGGYEGGAGGARGEPARGGTGYVSSEALDFRLLCSEPGSGRPPRTDDADYDGVAGSGEASGLVITRFVCEEPPLI